VVATDCSPDTGAHPVSRLSGTPAAPTDTDPEGGRDAVLDGLSEGVLLCDRDGVVRAANAVARLLLPALVVGEVIETAGCVPLTRAVRSGTATTVEADVPTRRGPRHIRGRRAPDPGPTASGCWYLDDVTDARRRADALLAAQERAAFLADAGRALHGVLHLDRTARRVATLSVPRLAAVAAVVVRHGDALTWVRAGPGDARPHQGRLAATALRTVPRLAAALAGAGDDPRLVDDLAAAGVWVGGAGTTRVLAVPTTGVVEAIVVLGGPRTVRSDPDPDEEDLLAAYVSRVGAALAASALHGEQTHLGTVLQESLAAPPLPETEGILWGASYRPARETLRVGGDFYEVVATSTRGGPPAFLLGDVCGKGIEAAVLSGRVRQSWHALRLLEDRPGRLLELLNTALLDAVAARGEAPRFVTMVLGDARPQPDGTVVLRLATGGHPPPLVLRADGRVEPVAVAGMLVGGVRDADFGEVAVLLGPGDTCLLYSDGVLEARGAGDFFGEERLAATLAPCAGAPPAVVCAHLEEVVGAWLDGRNHDDVALLAIQAPVTP
jgi:hypothetical protein